MARPAAAYPVDANPAPTETALLLRNTYGHDAVHVVEIGLRAAEDAEVAAVARTEARAVVTENVADFVTELKRKLPAGSAQVAALAKTLDAWAAANPDPYLGPHWPSIR
ncbi:MAG TPA: DUF5615 family PIN-like protein [Woeseiaceae bacterium]|nr:DUF5615 family PIN-like protein [Woeseiaceae bacterium]